MQAFLYINLTAEEVYRQEVVEQVKQVLPSLAILDLDAGSDELLQHYALRLLREAERTVVCIKADNSTDFLTSLMPLLEELFQEGKQRLVLQVGHQPRLHRIFSARPHVAFTEVKCDEVVAEVKRFMQ